MSVKFDKDSGTARSAENASKDLAHQVGERLTGGETGKGYLAVRVSSSNCNYYYY